MPRIARIVVPGLPHHITQRGNRRAQVYFSDRDYTAYLDAAQRYFPRHGLSVWAYCLMSNHAHWISVPTDEWALARGMRDLHTAYAVRLNRLQELSGHVWQGRFFSCVLDEAHLWAAIRYVERNPVRAGLVTHAADYPWSSAAAHCGVRHDPLLATDFPPPDNGFDWATWLSLDDENETFYIRQQTHTGRPCGSPEFMESLAERLQRSVAPKRRGRKPQSNR